VRRILEKVAASKQADLEACVIYLTKVTVWRKKLAE
jgi:hypothetical protein